MMSDTPNQDAIVYIGTYTQTLPHVQGKAEGIYVYQLERESGALHYLSVAPEPINPSFLVVARQGRFLYAVQELETFEGLPAGRVSAYAIDPSTHALTLINHQSTQGATPCYVSVDGTGRWLLIANHGGGSVCVLPIADDGSLGPATGAVQHHGPAGVAPHPHAIIVDHGNHYVLAPDAGLDRIVVYRLDAERGRLVEHDPPWIELPPGTGPRHLAFHPSGTFVYSINERASTISAFSYDPDHGTLRAIETVTTLPKGFEGRSACADIHFDPTGRYLYGSNRRHDSIAIFAVEPTLGRLSPAGHVPTGGRTPRNFAIDSTGRWLLAANQDTDTVVTFAVDPASGALVAGPVAAVPTPVCVCIVDV